MASLRGILLALVAALAVPAGAQAALLVDAQTTSATEQPAGDGLIGPGDGVSLTQTLLSSEPSLTNVSGHLTTSTAGVTVGTADAAFPDTTFGNTLANTSPFALAVGAGVPCGTNIDLSLALSADQGSQTVPLTIGTGAAGPLRANEGVDVPQAIPDGGSIASSFTVSQAGLVKNLRIRIGRLNHTYAGDLKLWIEAPDGTTVTLMDRRGGSGDDLVDTVFATTGANIASASPPFTGTYRAEGDLSRLIGHIQQGTWTLHVADEQLSDTGTLVSWGADLAQAVCDGNPIASFTATPNPVAPGSTVTLDASGSIDPNGTLTRYEWDLDGNGTYEVDGGTAPTRTTSYARGRHTIGLRVTDDQGHTDATTISLPVTQAPTAALSSGPASPSTGDTITLDASASSDPDGSVTGYAWDLDGNGTYETSTGGTSSTTTSFAAPGTHTVRVRVTDDDGATDTRALDIAVANRPPTARLTGPSPATAGQAATLDASTSSDPDGGIVAYAWDLDGDGAYETSTGSTATVSKTWAAAGTYTVRVRVTDAYGASDSTSLAVTVAAAAGGGAGGAGGTGGTGGGTGGTGGTAGGSTDGGLTGGTTGGTGTGSTGGGTTGGTGSGSTGGGKTGGGTTGGSGSGGAAGDGAAAGGDSGAPGTADGAFTASLLGAPIQAIKLARRKGLTFSCLATARASCALTVVVQASEARRLRFGTRRGSGRRAVRARTRVVGRGVVAAAPGTGTPVLVALSAPFRRALAHARTARLLVRGTATDARGRTVKLVRAVLLRR